MVQSVTETLIQRGIGWRYLVGRERCSTYEVSEQQLALLMFKLKIEQDGQCSCVERGEVTVRTRGAYTIPIRGNEDPRRSPRTAAGPVRRSRLGPWLCCCIDWAMSPRHTQPSPSRSFALGTATDIAVQTLYYSVPISETIPHPTRWLPACFTSQCSMS